MATQPPNAMPTPSDRRSVNASPKAHRERTAVMMGCVVCQMDLRKKRRRRQRPPARDSREGRRPPRCVTASLNLMPAMLQPWSRKTQSPRMK